MDRNLQRIGAVEPKEACCQGSRPSAPRGSLGLRRVAVGDVQDPKGSLPVFLEAFVKGKSHKNPSGSQRIAQGVWMLTFFQCVV